MQPALRSGGRIERWRNALASNAKLVACVAFCARAVDPLVSSQGGALLLVLSLSFACIHALTLWVVSAGRTFEWRDPSPVRTFLPVAVALLGCAVQWIPVGLAAARITIDIKLRHPRFLSVFSLSAALVIAFASLHLFAYLAAQSPTDSTFQLSKAAAGVTPSSAVALDRTELNLPRAFVTFLYLSASTQTFTGYGDVAPDSLGGNFAVALQMLCGVLISLGLKEQAIFLAWRSRRSPVAKKGEQTQASQRAAANLERGPHAEATAEQRDADLSMGKNLGGGAEAALGGTMRSVTGGSAWGSTLRALACIRDNVKRAYSVVSGPTRRWLVMLAALLQCSTVVTLAAASLLAGKNEQPDVAECVDTAAALRGEGGAVFATVCVLAACALQVVSVGLAVHASAHLVQPRSVATARYAVRVFVSTTLCFGGLYLTLNGLHCRRAFVLPTTKVGSTGLVKGSSGAIASRDASNWWGYWVRLEVGRNDGWAYIPSRYVLSVFSVFNIDRAPSLLSPLAPLLSLMKDEVSRIYFFALSTSFTTGYGAVVPRW